MNYKQNIVVFDLETSGLSPINDEVVQIAAVAIEPHTLEIIAGSQFESLIKPIKIFSGTEDDIRSH